MQQRALSDRVNTFGQVMLRRYGQRVHKLALNAGFTCPNRDGTKGYDGCSFCNNSSFTPDAKNNQQLSSQLEAGRRIIAKRTGARLFIAYFQAYSNTYAKIEILRERYASALIYPDIIGLAIGTRPDCVSAEVFDLLANYRAKGKEIWLELGLQSTSDHTLKYIQRGHDFADYRTTVKAAQQHEIPICTHLIIGLPGEGRKEALINLERVLELGVDGLKLHPLHVVRHTRLALDWQRGEYQPLTQAEYVNICADLIERTPPNIIYHRLTGTAGLDILLAPHWCNRKWAVLNAIEAELNRRKTRQGCLTS